MNKFVLKDGSEISLNGASSFGNLESKYDSKQSMLEDWDKLTAENLSHVKFMVDDVVTAEYDNLVLDSETSNVEQDNTVTTKWNIREKSYVEKLEDRIAELEGTQSIQDGAIEDLGSVTSIIAEQIGVE